MCGIDRNVREWMVMAKRSKEETTVEQKPVRTCARKVSHGVDILGDERRFGDGFYRLRNGIR